MLGSGACELVKAVYGGIFGQTRSARPSKAGRDLLSDSSALVRMNLSLSDFDVQRTKIAYRDSQLLCNERSGVLRIVVTMMERLLEDV